MSNISYHLIRGDKVDNVIAFQPDSDEPLHQADSNHPYWDLIIEGLHNDDDNVFNLFDVAKAAANKLMVLSERVTYDHGKIRFDGDEQTGPLADHLVRVIQSDTEDYAPIVKFWELVASNPSEHSREAMYKWLAKHDFTIDEDGYIVGYKSVNGDVNDPDSWLSTRAGHGFVDGVEFGGVLSGECLPNVPGSVVSMPRAEVDDNHNNGCSSGLHIGDWTFVEKFSGGVKVEVRVNPRDVVSIPNDDTRKMRCCRYEVIGIATGPLAGPVKLNVSESNVAAPVAYAPFA